jgi:hypothetical protein
MGAGDADSHIVAARSSIYTYYTVHERVYQLNQLSQQPIDGIERDSLSNITTTL